MVTSRVLPKALPVAAFGAAYLASFDGKEQACTGFSGELPALPSTYLRNNRETGSDPP
jgi:hypothetical protein